MNFEAAKFNLIEENYSRKIANEEFGEFKIA